MAKGKRKLNRRFYVLLALVALIALGVVAYKFLAPKRGKLGTDSIDMTLETVAAIIRDEVPVQVGDHSAIHFLVKEGDLVLENQQIAILYARGYETQLAEIIALEQTVYQQQLTLLKLQTDGETLPTQLTDFNDRIAAIIARMTEVTDGLSDEDYLDLEMQMSEILTARRDLLSQLVIPDASLVNNLNNLYALEAALTQRTPLINTGNSGYISFYLDGYEDAMVVDQLTSAQVRRITTSPTSNTYNDDALYRIVAPDHWYIALTVEANSPARLALGETYQVTLRGEDIEYSCAVVVEKVSATHVVYVLEVFADVRPVLTGRMATFVLEKQLTGVSVPVDVLYYVDGVPTLDVRSGSEYVPVAVHILGSNEEIAIIEAQNPSLTLNAGLRYQENKSAEDEAEETEPTDTSEPTTSPQTGDSAAPTPFAVP